jgi:hypothetical protein
VAFTDLYNGPKNYVALILKVYISIHASIRVTWCIIHMNVFVEKDFFIMFVIFPRKKNMEAPKYVNIYQSGTNLSQPIL